MASTAATAKLLHQANLTHNYSFYGAMLLALQKQPYLQQSAELLDAVALEVGTASTHFIPPLSALHAEKCPTQRELSNVLHLQRKHALEDRLRQVSRRTAAWFRSCGLFGSGQWLHSVPTLSCFQATRDEFRMMFLIRLGYKLRGASLEHIASCCGMPHSDRIRNGTHFHSACTLVSALRIWRHNTVRDDIKKMAKEVDLPARDEVRGLVGSGSNAAPADVLIPPKERQSQTRVQFRDQRGLDRALDVVIVDPCSDEALANGADSYNLVAATLADKNKLEQFNRLIRGNGPGVVPVEKVPISIESTGAWGPQLKAIWSEFKARHSFMKKENYIRAGLPYTFTAFTYQQFWPQKISFEIAKFTAKMVIEGLAKARSINSAA